MYTAGGLWVAAIFSACFTKDILNACLGKTKEFTPVAPRGQSDGRAATEGSALTGPQTPGYDRPEETEVDLEAQTAAGLGNQ